MLFFVLFCFVLTDLMRCNWYIGPSLVAQMVKQLPAMQETWVWYLGQEDPFEKEMATHSIILAWRIPRTKEPGRLQSMGSQRVGHDWATNTHTLKWILGVCVFAELIYSKLYVRFCGGTSGKELACQCSRHQGCGFDPWVRKIPEEGHGNNSTDREAWRATVRVTKSDTTEVT